jgi:hypothetical protein
MSTKVAPTNGTLKNAPNADTKPQATETKPMLPPITGSVIPIVNPKNELPPLDERFERMDMLFSLRDKYDKLKESLDKLNKFRLAADGRSEQITLKDSDGNTFATHNPEVLAKVIEWLKEDLTKKIKDVDNRICL